MKTIDVPFVAHHSGQGAVLAQIAHGLKQGQRTFVWEAGRRVGKTVLNQDIAVRNLVYGKNVGYWVPTFPDGRKIFSYIVDSLGGRRGLIKRVNSNSRSIELINGAEFDMWSLDKDGSGRGFHYNVAILDEAAKAKSLISQINETIGATTNDNDGYMLITSTPRGIGNEFHRIWLKGQVPNHDYLSFRTPSYANPHVPLRVLYAKRRTLHEQGFGWIWDQEYLAKPADNGMNPFSSALLARQRQRQPTNRPVIAWAIDLAKKLDFTVVMGFDDRGKISQFHRWTGMPWPDQEVKIKQIVASAPSARIIVDGTGSGGALADYLKKAGLPITTLVLSRTTRPILLKEYVIALNRGHAWILDGHHLREMNAAEYKETLTEDLDIRVPRPEHDDCLMTAAFGTKLLNELGYPRSKKIRIIGNNVPRNNRIKKLKILR